MTLAARAEITPPVHEYALTNGLQLIVQEDHRAPIVVSQVWYKVGSSYEREGGTGVSHALEHMMFKGTDKRGPNEFSRIIAENGGEENAFTGSDYTAYYQRMEKSRLPISFELEADRMRNLKLLDEEFAKEIKVVMEERRLRTEDKPEAATAEATMAMAYQTGAYRNPVIGWMHDLQAMKTSDLRDWYQTWYAPNNAALVVVGDVDPDAVHRLAEQHFGPLAKGQEIPQSARPEVPQQGIKRVVVRRPAQISYLIMAYKAPVLKTAIANSDPQLQREVYALEVLSGILGGGDSARLPRRLVRDRQIAAEVDVGYQLLARLDNVFGIDGIPAHGHNVDELEKAVRKEIELVKAQLIEPQELERVKTQVVAANVYERDSVFYQAMQIGMLITAGLDWRLKDEYVDKVKAVTAEEVRSAARKYLTDDRLTVAVLDPQPASTQPH